MMPEFKDKISLENVTIKAKTALALLCEIDGEEVWIPDSQIDDDSEIYRVGETGTLIISEWIANQKGLI